MTSLQEYKLSLFERCEAGDITVDERDLLLEAVSDEIDEVELEESKKMEIEDDEELEEAVADYLDTIEERFNEGALTEEEVDILLESLAGKVKAAKTAVTKPIHKRYDKIMDKRIETMDEAIGFTDDSIDSAKSVISEIDKLNDDLKKDNSISAKEKKETQEYNDYIKKHKKNVIEYQTKQKEIYKKLNEESRSNKNKSTKEKAKYLVGRDARNIKNKITGKDDYFKKHERLLEKMEKYK
jgi:hypothetical protein